MPIRWQAIIWTNDGLVYWCIYAWLHPNDLNIHCGLLALMLLMPWSWKWPHPINRFSLSKWIQQIFAHISADTPVVARQKVHITKLVASGNGMLPDGTKPLPEPILTFYPIDFSSLKACSIPMKFTRYQFLRKCCKSILLKLSHISSWTMS